MEKITFVCNPIIRLTIDHDGDIESYDLSVTDLITNEFWKLIEVNICATREFPATILSINIVENKYFYSLKIRYWDGVGVRMVNNLYGLYTDERIESEREYADI